MKVFSSGATGVLGHRLVERLAERGNDVVGLARDDDGAALVEERGGDLRRGDVLERETLERAIDDDADAIVHAATAIPTATKPTDEDWARNDRVRLAGARNLVDVAGDAVDRFLFPSIVWVARQPDGSPFDEDAERFALGEQSVRGTQNQWSVSPVPLLDCIAPNPPEYPSRGIVPA
jgi:nucleoside-diphosphate-sugar epimerase